MSPELIPLPGSDDRLAFGCLWRAVIDSDDYQTVAHRQAREAGANLLWTDPGEPIFGIAQIKLRRAPSKARSLHAAAIAFGKHAGLADAIALLRLPNVNKVWICITRNRMPVSGHDRICATEEAIEGAAQYLQQNPGFTPTIYGDIETDAFHMHHMSLPMLASVCGDGTRMFWVGRTMPRPLYVVVGVAVIAVIAYAQYQKWNASQEAQRSAKEKAVSEAEQARQKLQVYQQQLSAWLASHKLADNRAVESLRKALGEMPSEIAGWSLTGVNCTSGPSAAAMPPPKNSGSNPAIGGQESENAANGIWRCTASYVRTGSRKATNLAFDRARPAHWHVHWIPMNKLNASFEIPTELREPRLDKLLPASIVMTETTASIQEMDIAFASVELSRFGIPRDFPTPAADTKPSATDAPAAKVLSANISVAGPLRSFDLLIKKDLPAHWESVSVVINKSVPANISNSAVMATFKGTIYATTAD